MTPFTEVFRDDVLLVVDKAAGTPAQRTRDGDDGVYEMLCASESYVGLHHRLDRRASGLMVFAIDRSVNAALTRAFRKHTIERTYLALCEGEPVDDHWSWPVDGKPARTDVELLGPGPEGLTQIRCRLHTGRTHQIRIHSAMAGTPLAGDRRYGGDTARPWNRLGLHARTLSLRHPVSGTTCTWTAPIPWSNG